MEIKIIIVPTGRNPSPLLSSKPYLPRIIHFFQAIFLIIVSKFFLFVTHDTEEKSYCYFYFRKAPEIEEGIEKMLRINSRYQRTVLHLMFRFGLNNIYSLFQVPKFKFHDFSSRLLNTFLFTISSAYWSVD